MYICIYVVLILIIIIMDYELYKNILRTNVIFTLIWLFCASMAAIGYSNIDKTSDYINNLVIIYVIFFNVIYFFINNCNDAYYNVFDKFEVGVLNFRLPIFLCVFLLIISMPLLIKAIKLILVVGIAEFRWYAFTFSEEFASTNALVFFQNFVQPLYLATYIFIASALLNNEKNKTLNFVALLTIISNTIMFTGRNSIYSLIIILLIYLMLKYEIFNEYKLPFMKTIFWGGILSSVVYIVISLRKFVEQSVLNTIMLYYYGGFVFLDKKINDICIFDTNSMGGVSYGFLVNFFYIPIRALGYKISIPSYDYASWADNYVSIGNVNYNALGTIILSNIYDFGNLFFILGFIPVVIFISYADKLFYKNKKNSFYICLRIYAIICSIRCVQSNPTTNIAFTMTILFLFLFTKRKII